MEYKSTIFIFGAAVIIILPLVISSPARGRISWASTSIVGGGEVTRHSIPWQVAFVRRGSNSPFCGGTLITDRHVLTAAHCTESLRYEGEIIVGEHDITSSKDGTRHSYSRYVDHPLYSPNPENYDFSIIYLDKPVQIGERAFPANLPLTDLGGDYLNGKTLTVSGWGDLSEGGSGPKVLHSVEVPGMSNSICNQPDFYNNRITDVMLCAGVAEGKIDSCQSDSGGPLTYEFKGQTFIVGVVSWGIGCAREDKPGVYARVTEVLPWIYRQIGLLYRDNYRSDTTSLGTTLKVFKKLNDAIVYCNMFASCDLVTDVDCDGDNYAAREGSTAPSTQGSCTWVKTQEGLF